MKNCWYCNVVILCLGGQYVAAIEIDMWFVLSVTIAACIKSSFIVGQVLNCKEDLMRIAETACAVLSGWGADISL